MAVTWTGYENVVLENKMTDLMNSKLEVRGLMTIDTSLTESAGMRKTVNTYSYTGSMQELAKGAKNDSYGNVTFTPQNYDVKRYQQSFKYNDMDIMKDPYTLDVAMEGASTVMGNDIRNQYFAELAKLDGANLFKYGTGKPNTVFNYDTVVDALAKINQEIEEGMFIIMGNDLRALVRKDPEFKSSRQGEIMYTGQFGTIAGIPVLFSKLVPANTAYVATRETVRFFVKKEGTVEQSRNVETKDNIVVYERHGLIALYDKTKAMKIIKEDTP